MKYVIQITMQSGSKWIATGYDGSFALSPVDPNTGTAKGCFYFDTENEAEEYIRKLRLNPVGDKFFTDMEHEIIQALVAT